LNNLLDGEPDAHGKAAPPGPAGRLRGLHSLFSYTVLLPTLLAAVYYGFIASSIYVSESRLVLRNPQHPAASGGIGSLLQGAGAAHAQGDTYSVHDFILSRDALKQLDEQFRLRETFGSKAIDPVKRFAGLDWWNNSFEALHRYYMERVVSVDVDPASSIVTLAVSAFSAEDAYRINEKLVEMSEALVNQLNERSRQDLVRFAAVDVEIAQKKAEDAMLAVAQYRSLKSVFDPEKQSPLHLGFIAKLQDDLIATKTQLAQITLLSPDNPQLPALQQKIKTLQGAIDAESAKLTGGGGRSLSGKAAEYERLAFGQDFAQKQLAAALGSLEAARNEARRKQIYLERLVQPGKPDVALEPRRARSVLATFVLGLVAWGILTILLAGVREHRD
jgi:capsular polysaccharide transport system permease protein